MMPKAQMIGSMAAKPNCQSTVSSSTMTPTGATMLPATSGRMCATKVWVCAESSSMILRMRPVFCVSKNPSGTRMSRCIALRRMLVSTRNAARCENMSAAK